MLDLLTSPAAWASLITLVLMEIILGIDNIVFITIQTDRLPASQQQKGRIYGLGAALVTRILLLLSITSVMSLTEPLFNLGDLIGIHHGLWHERLAISGRDLILFVGGLFLIYKSVHEIHDSLEGEGEQLNAHRNSFLGTIIQIGLLDIVFSLDSVITAVGMADNVEIMIAAVVVAMIIMAFSVNALSDFVNTHPSIKMLALSFLLLIGISLVAESIEQPIAKGYIYAAMSFSLFVQFLIMRTSDKSTPVHLKNEGELN